MWAMMVVSCSQILLSLGLIVMTGCEQIKALPGPLPPLSLPVPGEADGPGEAVAEHVEDGELDVGDQDPLLGALLLDVPQVGRPLQSPGCQHADMLLLV